MPRVQARLRCRPLGRGDPGSVHGRHDTLGGTGTSRGEGESPVAVQAPQRELVAVAGQPVAIDSTGRTEEGA